MIACTSPAGTSRLSPFRISLPSTAACRFSTFSISMDLVGQEFGHQAKRVGHAVDHLVFHRRRRPARGDLPLVTDRDSGLAGFEIGADAKGFALHDHCVA